MKLPYRLGDSFALPLGDGSCIDAEIVDCEHHVVTIDVADFRLRVYDDALVLHRWRKGDAAALRQAQGDTVAMCHPERSRGTNEILSPARAERTIAQALGIRRFENDTIFVREVNDHVSEGDLAALPSDVTLVWDEPLPLAALDAVLASIEAHPRTRIRLHGAAVQQLPRFAASRVAHLTLGGPLDDWGTEYPSVVGLTLDAACDLNSLARAFPNLVSLRIGDGVRSVNARNLQALQLRELDMSHVSLEHPQALGEMQQLAALRLAHVRDLHSTGGIERLALTTLAIEHQPQLPGLDVLSRSVQVEQIELIGMWHLSIEECAWLFALPALTRARTDIGGRRKNVELYRRARWAHPWPSFSDVRVT